MYTLDTQPYWGSLRGGGILRKFDPLTNSVSPKWATRPQNRFTKFAKREAILFQLLLTENTKCGTLKTVNKLFVSRFGAERPRKDAGACSRSFGSRVCLGIFFALVRAAMPFLWAFAGGACHDRWSELDIPFGQIAGGGSYSSGEIGLA